MSRQLYSAGIEVANLYAAFVWLSMLLLEPGGQMAAITPRSFCNGPYFKKFRSAFLRTMNLKRIHLFESRNKAFGDDNVLQENIIYHAVRGHEKPDSVIVSTSKGLDFDKVSEICVPYGRVICPGDPDMFVHLDINNADGGPADRIKRFGSSLDKLGLTVSSPGLLNQGKNPMPSPYPPTHPIFWLNPGFMFLQNDFLPKSSKGG